ncbi:MAG: hypothetical protein HYS04_03055 [Acidobacteria bacterium]|nr:hypothetical protein [Acidobacteriota bacterium]
MASLLYGGVWKRLVAAFLLGWLLPAQVLHRLVRRYRRKLQDALPNTLLGRRDFFSPLHALFLAFGLALCASTGYSEPGRDNSVVAYGKLGKLAHRRLLAAFDH